MPSPHERTRYDFQNPAQMVFACGIVTMLDLPFSSGEKYII